MPRSARARSGSSKLYRRLGALFPLALTATLAAVVVALPPRAALAHSWVFRPITLPRGTAALDIGFAIGRSGDPDHRTGPGMSFEIAYGLSSDLELGLRAGGRFGTGGKITRADEYARIFETETYSAISDGGFTGDGFVNPEIRMRWALVRGTLVQLAFDARFFLPVENGSRFGIMPALPLWLRFGAVRFDTGIYVPIVFTEPTTTTVVSFPLAVWIQATSRVFIGPELGVRYWDRGPTYTTYPFGFGLGWSMGPSADLRLRAFFRDIAASGAARDFGVGIAFQFRV
jgi:hypothetical protein